MDHLLQIILLLAVAVGVVLVVQRLYLPEFEALMHRPLRERAPIRGATR